KNGLKSKDIQRIVLRFPKSGTELIDGSELRSHSAQYILPVGALNQQIMIDDILYDRTVEPEVKRLVENMEIVGDDDLDKFFPERYAAIVEITTKNGEKFDERVDYAAGTPENPFRQEDIEKKYFSLSQQVIDYDKAKKILKIVEKLEDVDDINILGDYLRR
ncbi:MAG: MmgE/PrpD family protein, partial [Candidatus Heimdallarchaeota archaeon]|nr:MmgE/PrpD family protein [Candidatus Heimdallarchaeota archaeon]